MEKRNPMIWWLAGLLVCGLIYLLSPILTPFLVAAILAYIANPLVNKIDAFQFKNLSPSRTVASLLVMCLILAVILLILLIVVPLIQKEVVLLLQKLPAYFNTAKSSLEPWLQKNFGVGIDIDFAQIQQILTENWKTAGNFAKNIAQTLSTKGLVFIGWLANLVLIPLVLFYLLVDWNILVNKVGQLIPRKYIAKTQEIALEIDAVLAEFLRGQLSVMLLMSMFYSAGLWLAGLEVAVPIGILSGLLGFIPYLGFGLGLILGLFSALLQFGSITDIIPVLVVFGLGQIVESMVLTPYLVGDRIGLHPLVVIFALMAGGQLFGFAGVLLALPVSAALAVGFRHAKQTYLTSQFYNG
ncbi:MAG: AI-2E family transporter [Methylotenera sp.]|jgi:predicted PurR-regulated permease PerM|nr:MAG: AI-2E family transporter [Methylotenera sp.]HOY86735.1 AI-2E family transporter [Methylotenera sp.]HPH07958.1 AI-2E family transporter [Methylotenera sp.]HPM49658.1 AI-2E family transporter [Methylotenera sp.]HQM86259.1 AI-2E family transporter [Methylotenera sp.]